MLRQVPNRLKVKRIVTVFLLEWVAFCLLSCVSHATSTYPSYERTIARHTPPGSAEGIPVNDTVCVAPGECNCPRIWYRDHWVYHCDGRWVYWHHGYWYHYPHFHVYYYEGVPRVHRGSSRSIKKK